MFHEKPHIFMFFFFVFVEGYLLAKKLIFMLKRLSVRFVGLSFFSVQ